VQELEEVPEHLAPHGLKLVDKTDDKHTGLNGHGNVLKERSRV
jgi:hypothetical protein